jgi:Fe-S-cluster-containing dehydrogenase component
MGLDRRDFLKVAGTALIGAAGLSSVRGLAQQQIAVEQLADEYARPLTAARWGMVVDLPKCHQLDGCRDCIEACHSAHNVPDFLAHGGDPKHVVKWIWQEKYENAFPEQFHEYLPETLREKPVLVFCNHCDNPPCVRVCPTKATWKRADGVVMMDWHRCIGCRYCVAACPYGSRSFNWQDPRPFIDNIRIDFPTRTKGVVEKCDFCEERLAEGKLPACVLACKEKALTFGDLGKPDSTIREILRSRFSMRRKPGLGTRPEILYLV